MPFYHCSPNESVSPPSQARTTKASTTTRNELRQMNEKCQPVLKELTAIRAEMIAAAVQSQPRIDQVHVRHRDSARNLLHYLALRRLDLRQLQIRLAELGLSSLGRAEPHVLATIDAVLYVLRSLTGGSPAAPRRRPWRRTRASISPPESASWPRMPKPFLDPRRRGGGVGSWSPCRARRRTISLSFTTCWRAAWTACGSIARTTPLVLGCG